MTQFASPALSMVSNPVTKCYDLVVIGGGSAGLTAAKFSRTFGKSVAIVEKEKMGGDCTWTGCIPSKSLIASAKAAHAVRKAADFGVEIEGKVTVNMKTVSQRLKRNIEHIYKEDDSPEAMRALGIDVISGTATFLDPKSLEIRCIDGESKTVCANDGVLIATGAKPKIPTQSIEGLDSVHYITYEEVFDLEDLPDKVTVVGGGPIGCELAQALSRLGSKVTVVASSILPGEDSEVGGVLKRVFQKEGITITGSNMKQVKPLSATGHEGTCCDGTIVMGDLMLVAVGREPVVKGMALDKIGVEINEAGGIKVNERLQTSVKNVYAAGDCTGDRQFTHYAGYQGAVGARNILLPFTDPGVLENVPSTTFTDPEISSVGMAKEDAANIFGADCIAVIKQNILDTDRGVCEGNEEGFIQVIYRKKNYEILGATIVSPVAGELIAEIGVAMKSGLTFDMMATVMHTYPSHSFALQAMAAEVYYDKLVKSKRILNLLKKIGL